MISVRSLSLIALGVVAVGAACSPTESTTTLPIDETSGSDVGSGGSATSSGAGGGQVATASGGAMGTAAGGAATSGAGGSTTMTAAGGADAGGGTVTCAGTGISGGYVDNGTICGFAWTGAFGDSPTIDPPCGTGDCFMGADLCASGTLSATDEATENYTGVMIGVNAQTSADGATESTWSAAGSIAVEFTTGGLTGEARILLQSGGSDYCVPAAVSGTAYPITDFATECWGSAGTPLAAGTPIDSVIVQVNGGAADETFTDFCVTGITNM